MNGYRHGLALVTLLSAIASILVFPTGDANGGDGRDVLISGLPVSLRSYTFAVNADETAYAIGGESGIVVELALPSRKFKRVWRLGERIYKIFRDADKYVVVAEKNIYLLEGAEAKKIGTDPAVAALTIPPQVGGTRISYPLACRDGRIIWSAKTGNENQTAIFSTDVSGGAATVCYRGVAMNCRVAPGGEWALAGLGEEHPEWLITPEGLTEVDRGGALVGLGHTGFALQFDKYRLVYSAAEKKFTRVEGVLPIFADAGAAYRDMYVSGNGYFITKDSWVVTVPVSDKIRLCAGDDLDLFLVDERSRSFVRANVETDKLEVTSADGIPLHYDAQIRVATKDQDLYINDKEVKLPLPLKGDFTVRRAGGILCVLGKMTYYLIDIATLSAELVYMNPSERLGQEIERNLPNVQADTYAVPVGGNGHLCLIKTQAMAKGGAPNQQWIAVNPRQMSEKLVVEMNGKWLAELLILDDRIVAFRRDKYKTVIEAFEFVVDFAAKSATLREIPKATPVPFAGKFALDIWSRGQPLLSEAGREVPVPPVCSQGEGLMDAMYSSLYLPIIITCKGSHYIRCGCNYVRIVE
ncbi:MAG: hypothetical protein WC712_03880 [Candidatus Brocadiia bacterium]